MSSIRERLAQACAWRRIKMSKMCRDLHINYSAFMKAVSKENEGYKHWPRIATYFNTTKDWLLDNAGAAPWEKESGEEQPGRRPGVDDLISSEEKYLNALEYLRSIKDPHVHEMIDSIKDYIKSLEMNIALIGDRFLDIEEILKGNDIDYSRRSFERIREYINRRV